MANSNNGGFLGFLAANPVLGLIIGIILGLLIGFGVGRWQGSAAIAAQQTGYETKLAESAKQLQASQAQTAATQAELKLANDRAKLISARSDLFYALNALDQRNFGTAAEHVTTAASRLNGIDAKGLGLDEASLTSLSEKLTGLNLLVATDLQQQRTTVMELSAQLEGLIGKN